MTDVTFSENYTTETYAPMEVWAKDHWSCLAYINSIMTDMGGFQVGFDGRMSQNRRNFRVMQQFCPNPKRPNPANAAMVMDERYSTRIREGEERTSIRGHDDHCSVQDMANAGLFTVGADDYDVGDTLTFSEKGYAVSAALARHKQEGGNYADFTYIELDG